MKGIKKENIDTYYNEAGSWANDKISMLQTSRRIAWWIAGCFIFISILLLIALIELMPLKKIVPYTLLVDKHTGYVETIKPSEASTIKPEAALTESFLVQYVTSREGFDINSLQRDFKRVSVWTADPEKSKYIKLMQASNPESPLVLYPRASVVNVKIKSVTPMNIDTNLVRFDTQREDANGQQHENRSWAAVIKYKYNNSPISQEERFINPLGFQVVHYNKSEEILSNGTSNSNQDKSYATELESNVKSKVSNGNNDNRLLGGSNNEQNTIVSSSNPEGKR